MNESHQKLIEWIEKVEEQLDQAKKIFITKDNSKLIYMIGNTSSDVKNSHPYTTPLRKISGAYIIGSIVFTQAQKKI